MRKTFLLLALLVSCGSSPQPEKTELSTSHLYEDDPDNCGASGYACKNGRTCIDSLCTPAWQSISSTSAPTPRINHAAGSLNGKYITFGGCFTTGMDAATATSAYYDPSMDSWTNLPDLNAGRAQFAAATTGFGIYTYGGVITCNDGSVVATNLEVLYSIDSSWQSIPVPNSYVGVYNESLSWVGDSLFLYGGNTNSTSNISSGMRLKLGNIWEDVSCPLTGCGAAVGVSTFLDNNVVKLWFNGSMQTEGFIYNLENNEWYTWIVPDSTPSISASNADDNRRIYYLDPGVVNIYDRVTKGWLADSASMPMGLCGNAAVAWVDGELIAWSGYCNSGFSSIGGRYQPPAPGVAP